ncbi:MAG: serine protease [Deltaproteobacteria bacterium]|nr:serine protease [Deltaproteobacteria bacterium]
MVARVLRGRHCRICLALAIAIALGGATFTPYRFQEIFHQNAAAVVRLRATILHGERFGSAFLVHPNGTLVTAAASVFGASALHLVDTFGNALAVELVASDQASGVAVLRAPSSGSIPVARLGRSARLRRGDWLVGVAYAAGSAPEAIAGCISAITGVEGGGRVFTIDAATDAGGPFFNVDGEVVAVSIGLKGARRARAIPIDDVRDFIVTAMRAPASAAADAGRGQ